MCVSPVTLALVFSLADNRIPLRTFRLSDVEWEAAKVAAAGLGTTPSAEIKRALRRLVMRHARSR